MSMTADPSSPWHAATGAVLLHWRDDEAGAGAEEEGESPAAPSTAPLTIGTAATSAAASTGGAAGTAGVAVSPQDVRLEDRTRLAGPDLLSALQREVARALRASPAQVDPRVALVDFGLDSMTMVALGPVLRAEFGLEVADEHLFADGLTLDWMVANAAALRVRATDPAAAVPVPPHSAAGHHTHPQPHQHQPREGQLGGGAAPAGGPAAPPATVGGVVALAAAPLRPRRELTWFQRNMPCCVCCM